MTPLETPFSDAASIVAQRYGVSDAHLRMIFNGMGNNSIQTIKSLEKDLGKQRITTFPTDIHSQIQLFSRSFSEIKLLTNTFWVLIDNTGEKVIYKFRRNQELLVIRKGNAEKASWACIEKDAILVDIKSKGSTYLLKNAFFDPDFLLLNVNCSNDVAFLVNERLFDKTVTSKAKIEALLIEKYIRPQSRFFQNKKGGKTGTENSELPKYSALRKDMVRAKSSVLKFEIVFSPDMSGEIFINKKRGTAYFIKPGKRFLFNKKCKYKDQADCIKGLYDYLSGMQSHQLKEDSITQQSNQQNSTEKAHSFHADKFQMSKC